MKIVTNIEDFIAKLSDMEKEKGIWTVYPEIAGYKTDAVIKDNIITINKIDYDFSFFFSDKNLIINSKKTKLLIAPKVDSEWIDLDNLSNTSVSVKQSMDRELISIKENCYIFTYDQDSGLPLIPYYQTYNTLYDLLDDLNHLDRNLRTTDWLTIGISIRKGNKEILYVKPPMEAITTIKEISYNVGRTGVIVPIVKFEPVNFNGTLTLQSTLHNSKVLSENNLKLNDIIVIKIKRQGHQNTELTSVLYPCTETKRPEIITRCPSCNSVLILKKRSNFLICPNSLCQEKLIKRILHWCSSECMDIKGLGLIYTEHLVKSKMVTTVDDLYVLTKKDLTTVPGILGKMADNILAQIKLSRRRSLINVFMGLGIEGIGGNTSKLLSWHLMSVYNLLMLKSSEIKKLSIYLSDEQGEYLIDYLKNELNKEMLLNLSRHLHPKLPEIKMDNHIFFKKRFILKNSFPVLGREKVKNILRRAGSIVLTINNPNYDYCLYHDNRKVIKGIDKKKTIKLSKLLTELIC